MFVPDNFNVVEPVFMRFEVPVMLPLNSAASPEAKSIVIVLEEPPLPFIEEPDLTYKAVSSVPPVLVSAAYRLMLPVEVIDAVPTVSTSPIVIPAPLLLVLSFLPHISISPAPVLIVAPGLIHTAYLSPPEGIA